MRHPPKAGLVEGQVWAVRDSDLATDVAFSAHSCFDSWRALALVGALTLWGHRSLLQKVLVLPTS